MDDLSRYAGLIGAMLAGGGAFVPEAEDASAVQVERGVVFPQLLAGAAAEALPAVPPATGRVVDRRGHERPVYRGLLVYCWLQALRLAGRNVAVARAWCQTIGRRGVTESLSAAQGAKVAAGAWEQLALSLAGGGDGPAEAAPFFEHLAAGQQRDGAFLRATASDNPETHWYHELVILGAAASYAVQFRDDQLLAVVRRNAEFHAAETQPDHATAQPWGLLAFVLHAPARPVADQLLHTVRTLSPAGPDGVALMLLGDCLYCLRLLLGARP